MRVISLALLACVACNSAPTATLLCPPGTINTAEGRCVPVATDGGPSDGGLQDGSAPDAGAILPAHLDRIFIDFGMVTARNEVEEHLTVRNPNSVPIDVTPRRLRSLGAIWPRDIALDQPLTIPAHGSIDIVFVLASNSPMSAEAEFEIDLCPANCRTTVLLVGEVVDSVVECDPVFFPQTVVGSQSTAEIGCRNLGRQTVTLDSWEIRPRRSPFEITVPAGPIPPGGEVLLTLTFEPMVMGEYEATLIGWSQGAWLVDVEIFGEAIDTTNGCSVQFLPILDFGIAVSGSVISSDAMIANVGTMDCVIEMAGMGPGSPEFQLVSPSLNSITSLAPNESMVITVSFTPLAPGGYVGSVELVTDDPMNPNPSIQCTAGVSGGILEPSFQVSATPLIPLVPTPGTDLHFVNSDDDGYAEVPIPFPFTFLGTPVSIVQVSTNGFITFEPNGQFELNNRSIPDPSDPNSFIAFWWDDLFPRQPGFNGSVTTALVGSPPDQTLAITFLNTSGFGQGRTTFDVEIRLQENNNEIEVHYGQMFDGSPPTDFSASVGWEAVAGRIGRDVLLCSPDCDRHNWLENTLLRYVPTP